jgi:hypothetical protein
MSGEWRYSARRLNGDGTSTLLDPDLPLQGVNLTKVLSGPDGHQSRIAPAVARLITDDGRPLIQRWSTAIFAERDDQIQHGCIVSNVTRAGSELGISGVGFSGYAQGKIYQGDKFFIQTDPLDIVRHIWAYLQGRKNGNIGLVLDNTKQGTLIGTKLLQAQFDSINGPASFEAGPYKLNFWETDNLGGKIDDLATAYPFDYKESHAWNADGSDIVHRLHFGVPRFGRRRDDLRFVVGENVLEPSSESMTPEGYASEVIVRGAGEGRLMILGHATRDDGLLATPVVIEDKNIKSVKDANRRAAAELAMRSGKPEITEITVMERPGFPTLGSWTEGDDIELVNYTEWGETVDWYRVLSTTIAPENLSVAKLAVLRADMIPA